MSIVTRSSPWLAAVAALTLASCGPAAPESPATRAAPVEASLGRVAVIEWPAIHEAGGVVRARQTAVLSSRVVAPVTEIRVQPGDRVRRGQTLVVLDGRELEAQVARASATAAASTLALEAAQAEHRAAASTLTLARVTHERVRGLREKESATPHELDQATATLAAAEAREAGAHARVAEAGQAIVAARASERVASLGVSYAALAAPFDGIVSARHADAGSLAAPGVPLLTLDDTAGYRLEARIDESRAHLVAAGTGAEVRLDGAAGDGGAPWQAATVSEVAAIDPGRHSFVVRLDLPAADGLRSGLFGRVRLRGPARRVLAAPAPAIVRRGQLTFVFVVDATGAARLQMVSVGDQLGAHTEVLAGLSEGDEVVLDPAVQLTDGQTVRRAAAGTRGDAK